MASNPHGKFDRSLTVPGQVNAVIGSVEDLDAAISSLAADSLAALSHPPMRATRVHSAFVDRRRGSGDILKPSRQADDDVESQSLLADESASVPHSSSDAIGRSRTAPTLRRITESEELDDDLHSPAAKFDQSSSSSSSSGRDSPAAPATPVQFHLAPVDSSHGIATVDVSEQIDGKRVGCPAPRQQLTVVTRPESPPAKVGEQAEQRFGLEQYYGGKRKRGRSWRTDENGPLTPPLPEVLAAIPDALFIQLDELYENCPAWGEMEWRETGRWIKYEEHVEEGAERWSKPHVASLCVHSLLELRQCIERGTVLLELNVADVESLMHSVVNALERTDHVDDTNRDTVLKTLMLSHSHVGCHDAAHAHQQAHNSLDHYFYRQQAVVSPEVDGEAVHGVAPSGQSDSALRRLTLRVTHSFDAPDGHRLSDASRSHQLLGGSHMRIRRLSRHHHHHHVDQALMRRLPKKSEAAAVMVGAVSELVKPVFVFVRLAKASHLDALVEVPVPLRFCCILVGPLDAGLDYHEVGRCVATLLSNERFQEMAFAGRTKADLIHGVNEFMDDSIVLPPGDWEQQALMPYEQIKAKSSWIRKRRRALTSKPTEVEKLLKDESWLEEPLERTGKLFGGLRREVSRRAGHFKSDFTDACSLKCAASVVFIFLTCFFPALTFGAILGESTKGAIGIKETLFATSVGGVIFSLTSAQPMLLLGVSGPMLIFEESVYNFCQLYDVAFLNGRIWISIWAFLFCLITVALEGSFFIRYVTRFSDDILSALVSIIFISESISFIQHMFIENPVILLDEYCGGYVADSCNVTSCTPFNGSATSSSSSVGDSDWRLTAPQAPQPNVALLSAVLVIATCLLAIILRAVRNSKYFGRHVRRALGDLGLVVSILLVVLVDDFVFGDELTTKLTVTAGARPTSAARAAWFVRPWRVAAWVPPSACVGGLLLFLILFCETEVCEMTLAKRSNCLRKGTGYHWDLLVSGALLVACSLFGLPWLCAVSVRSMAHLHSLANFELGAPGQRPRVEGVVEQRVTSLVLHILIGLTVLATEVLRRIPVAVLFGVFLYLGVMNMFGVQMMSRAILFFVPVKHHPSVVYCLRVRTWRMNLFTGLQLTCFVAVCLVKYTKSIAFAYPLAIMLAIGFRQLIMPAFFTQLELAALDGEEAEQDEEPDFYEESRLPV